MSSRDVRDPFHGLSGPSRRRAVARAQARASASLEVARARRTARETTRLIREAARAIVAGRRRLAS